MGLSELFSEEELSAVKEVPVTRSIHIEAVRHGTRELLFLAHEDLEPLVRGLLQRTPLDMALGSTFYRILCCLRTLCELDKPTQFQAISGTTRTCLELCMDVHLLTGRRAIDRAAEKFHAFTGAARFESAWQTTRFYDGHPELVAPDFVAERRALAERAGRADEVEAVCLDLWNSKRCPKHWSGMRWRDIASHIGAEMEARVVEWFSLYAWHVHGGGAGVGGLDKDSFESIEVLCRVEVREVACDALELLARALFALEAVPHLSERIRFTRDEAETASSIDQRLQALGRPTKISRRVPGI